MVDMDGNMYFRNNRFIELFGYAPQEIAKLDDWWIKAYPDPQYRDWVIRTWSGHVRRSEQTGSDIQPGEYRVTCKDGQVRDVEISGIAFGERYLATLIDNTERNRIQAELQKAKESAEEANLAKSLFLASMSHELRTPLNAMLGFASLLGRDPAATAAQQEKLAIIGRSGEHLLGMINDILDLSKIEAGRLELREAPFDLWHLLAEISAMIQSRAGEKGLAFALDAEAIAAPYLAADAGKVRQILLNLLGNAVKFTDAGAITLRCGTEPIAGEPGRCRVWMEVADTGPGIPDAVQAHIFEPFVQGARTAETKGAGLGLAIS
jgi:PAS domain S-box-containing protein